MYHSHFFMRKFTVPVLLSTALVLTVGARGALATSDAQKCQSAVAQAAEKFEVAKIKALSKCSKSVRKAKLPAGTDCFTEAATATKISDARQKLFDAISSKCGGLTLTDMGWDGSGNAGNPVLARQCSGGDFAGRDCGRETECPGICNGGEKDTQSCTFNSSCQLKACVKANCIGGSEDGNDCSSNSAKDACESGGGTCPWKQSCGGGSSSSVGTCVGGTTSPTCVANSDCTTGGTCVSGCNTTDLADCQSGICEDALCATNKDCGLCVAVSGVTPPQVNASCAADSDCGKVCSGGGSNDGAMCKTNADCNAPGTCNTLVGSCLTGTCTGGFCGPTDGAHGRANTGICSPVDRCPNFESNKFTSVQTCDSGGNNGDACASDGDCPGGLCKSGCSFGLTDSSDVADCLACLGEASVDQLDHLFGNLSKSASTDKSTDKCRAEIYKSSGKFFSAKRKALEKCEATVIKAGSGTCPDSKANDKIAKASAKLQSKIGKACGGDDKGFGGGDDEASDNISTAFNCDNLTVPGGASCAGGSGRGPIDSAEDLANCLACVAEFKVDCIDRLATPFAGALFSECNPLCGNGKIDGQCSITTSTICGSTLDCPSGETCIPIETCDDGNSVTGDNCPGNCFINSCTPDGGTATLKVEVTGPAGVDLGGLSLYIEYPDGTVSIPGKGNAQSVVDSVTTTFSSFTTPNDLDYAVRLVTLANPPEVIESDGSGDPITITFATCQGGSPSVGQFRCKVESAADTQTTPANVDGVSCSLILN